jgi:iron complex outermembrane recepter protein
MKLTSLSVFLVTLAAMPALAQQSPPVAIPPVEVVATRVPQAPHDVPMSIEVIRGEDIRARGARNLQDALALTAGVSIAPGGDNGPAGAVPEFWGLREFDAFLLVVDGVPWGGALNPAIPSLSMRDVERVEVLRGPAPVTYGATSFVGVIHVVHKNAAAGSRSAEVFAGTFGTVGAGVDLPVALGSWSSRLTLDGERVGYRDEHTAFRKGHALFRTGKITESSQTWVNADLNLLQQDPASPHPRQGAALSTAVPLDANYNPSGAFINENRFALSAGHRRPALNGATWGSTASFTFSAQEIFRGFLTNISNTSNNAAGFRENIDIADFYADTHLIFPRSSNVQFLAGADILFAAGEGEGATFTYTAPLSGASRPQVQEPTTFDRDAEDERRFLGAYGSAEWRPSSRLALTGGLRMNATSEKRGEGAESAHSRLSGSVGALLGLWENGADHLRAFANYRSTFKPAAFDFGLAENEGVLEPETSVSYEAGLKATAMSGAFDMEVSAFHMDFENLVTATVINNQPALVNSGTTRFKGIELASELRLPHSMMARATYSFHHGKFVDYTQSFDGTPTQLGGKRFEMSARKLASAGLVLSPDEGLFGNVVVNYTGDRYLNKRNTALAPAFTAVNAGAGFRTGALEFRVDGTNLTDKRDPVAESEFGDAQYYRMPARTIRAGIGYRF